MRAVDGAAVARIDADELLRFDQRPLELDVRRDELPFVAEAARDEQPRVGARDDVERRMKVGRKRVVVLLELTTNDLPRKKSDSAWWRCTGVSFPGVTPAASAGGPSEISVSAAAMARKGARMGGSDPLGIIRAVRMRGVG